MLMLILFLVIVLVLVTTKDTITSPRVYLLTYGNVRFRLFCATSKRRRTG